MAMLEECTQSAERQEFAEYYSHMLAGSLNDEEFPQSFSSRYRVLSCLAHTENKRLYHGLQLATGLPVFIKATLPCAPDSASREAQLLQGLCHPGIPRYVEHFSHGGWDFLVREYREGKTLAGLVAHQGPLPQADILDIAEKLTAIVASLHRAQPPVIHRDIKPQNLIVADDGSLFLIDFGIARNYNSECSHDTVYLGSYGYASPEQFGFSQTGPRTDIYAIGGLLYFLATGQDRGYQDKLSRVSSPALRRIIRRCTRLEAGRRYGGAASLSRAIALARRFAGALAWLRRYGVWALLALALLGAAIPAARVFTGMLTQSPATAEVAARLSPPLEQAVRASLGLGGEEPVTQAHLLAVERLVFPPADGQAPAAERVGEQTLAELHQLPNLRELVLAGQGLNTISGLDGLMLERLDLSDNNLVLLDPLAGMTSLVALDLSANPVAELGPLKKLAALQTLGLAYTEVTSLEAIKGLSALRSLDLGSCQLSSAAALASLSGLQKLGLAHLRLESFSFLSALPNLTSLNLSGTGFGNLSLIAATGLLELDLSYNYNFLSQLEGLERFASLQHLNITGAAAQDLSPLAALPALKSLALSSGPLAALPELAALDTLMVTGEENRAEWEALARERGLRLEVLAYPKAFE